MIVDLKLPLAGSKDARASLLKNLIDTVLVALIHAKNPPFAGTDAFGTPNIITSPTAAPVTVIVKSVLADGNVDPKSKVAVAVTEGSYALGEYAITITININVNRVVIILYPRFFIIFKIVSLVLLNFAHPHL